jgi:hypothetical protein
MFIGTLRCAALLGFAIVTTAIIGPNYEARDAWALTMQREAVAFFRTAAEFVLTGSALPTSAFSAEVRSCIASMCVDFDPEHQQLFGRRTLQYLSTMEANVSDPFTAFADCFCAVVGGGEDVRLWAIQNLAETVTSNPRDS